MPKIDPITGCTVMTQAEFWTGEAEREGKGRTAGEVATDFWQEIADDSERVAAEWRKPEVALGLIQKARCDDPENPDPEVVEVVEVVESTFSQNTRSSEGSLLARVKTRGGTEIKVRYNVWSDSGTRLDPPDHEEYIEVVP
jgi:hypothetical protein